MNRLDSSSPLIALQACPWRLCVLISQDLCGSDNWWGVAQSVMAHPTTDCPTVDCIQLREKAISDRELLNRAQQLVALCRPRGVHVIINDRPDIAVLAGADGVHLGQDDLPCKPVRKMIGPKMIIGVSTSDLAQAKQALHDGADYCGVGPMFPTTTKFKQTIPGPAYLKRYLAWGKLPHLAIGGICPDNVATLCQLGVVGVAVSSAVCSADDPAGAIARFSQVLGTSWSDPGGR